MAEGGPFKAALKAGSFVLRKTTIARCAEFGSLRDFIMEEKRAKMDKFKPEFTCQRTVLQEHCDFADRMRPAALLHAVQQAGTDHCNAIGMTPAFYKEHHMAFLLAKQVLEIYRTPTLGETLTYMTRPETPRRAIYKRLHRIEDEAGLTVAEVDSRWVLVDVETRRILRHMPKEMNLCAWPEPIDEELSLTIAKAAEMEAPVEQVARYSLCDRNGHLNNASWLDVLCDALPLEQIQAAPLCRAAINYHWEVPMGHEFTLSRGRVERGWYLNGQRDGRCCIEAELDF